jgi:hypothetical protein
MAAKNVIFRPIIPASEAVMTMAANLCKFLAFFCLLLGIVACEIRLDASDERQAMCVEIKTLKSSEYGSKLREYRSKNNLNCTLQLLNAATLLDSGVLGPPESDDQIVAILIDMLKLELVNSNIKSAAMNKKIKIAALKYLSLHSKFAESRGFSLNDYADFIRAEVKHGSREDAIEAFALLESVMDDTDIPLVVKAIETGEGRFVALGMFALANRCSPEAIKALKKIVGHPAVTSYVEKYRGKESISRSIRQFCPTVYDPF